MHATVRQDLILGLTLTAFSAWSISYLSLWASRFPIPMTPASLSRPGLSFLDRPGGTGRLAAAHGQHDPEAFTAAPRRRAARKPGQSRAPELGRIDAHPSGLRAALSLLLLH